MNTELLLARLKYRQVPASKVIDEVFQDIAKDVYDYGQLHDKKRNQVETVRRFVYEFEEDEKFMRDKTLKKFVTAISDLLKLDDEQKAVIYGTGRSAGIFSNLSNTGMTRGKFYVLQEGVNVIIEDFEGVERMRREYSPIRQSIQSMGDSVHDDRDEEVGEMSMEDKERYVEEDEKLNEDLAEQRDDVDEIQQEAENGTKKKTLKKTPH